MTRADDVAAFLEQAGWGDAEVRHLAGDASARRYDRVVRAGCGTTAVLMDADPAGGVPTRPFVEMARRLTGWGLSAPAILAWDAAVGLMLIEDFGDALFARLLEPEPEREEALYAAAVDVLIALHRQPVPPGFPVYTHADMAGRAALAASWYLPGTGAARRPECAAAIEAETARLLARYAPACSTVVLRDYHAENLIWLPERSGVAQVGLLDFQDAMAGHPLYDLVSLLEDARRDVSAAVRDRMLARYRGARGLEEAPFQAACAVLAAQRNLRILGVFARLCLHYGKAHYVSLMPRVWEHLQRDLAHPAVAPLANVVRDVLPEPTEARLDRLREARGTWSMQ